MLTGLGTKLPLQVGLRGHFFDEVLFHWKILTCHNFCFWQKKVLFTKRFHFKSSFWGKVLKLLNWGRSLLPITHDCFFPNLHYTTGVTLSWTSNKDEIQRGFFVRLGGLFSYSYSVCANILIWNKKESKTFLKGKKTIQFLCREGLFLSQPYMYLKSHILDIIFFALSNPLAMWWSAQM